MNDDKKSKTAKNFFLAGYIMIVTIEMHESNVGKT